MSGMKKKVLVLYISRYSGHYRAAEALEAAFAKMPVKVDVTKINALTYTNPILEKVINRTYIELIKKRPEIWEHIYDNPDFMKKTKKARETLHRFNMSKVGKLMEKYSPDAVYCTQAFPCGMVSDYKKTFSAKVPLVGVLTDHAPHSYWLHDEVDIYVVPSHETAVRLMEKGVPENKIRIYGIPVDPGFSVRQDKEKILAPLGLESDRPTVLLMGGSQGFGAIEEAVRSLMSDRLRRYQLVVVTGSNRKLMNRLKKYMKRESSGSVVVLPYITNVDSLMDASDVIVTKAGGLTISEALVKALPMLIVKPIPGHERMNTDYMVSKGAALEVKDMSSLHKKLNGLFDDAEKLKKMSDNAADIALPESALNTALLLLEDLGCSITCT